LGRKSAVRSVVYDFIIYASRVDSEPGTHGCWPASWDKSSNLNRKRTLGSISMVNGRSIVHWAAPEEGMSMTLVTHRLRLDLNTVNELLFCPLHISVSDLIRSSVQTRVSFLAIPHTLISISSRVWTRNLPCRGGSRCLVAASWMQLSDHGLYSPRPWGDSNIYFARLSTKTLADLRPDCRRIFCHSQHDILDHCLNADKNLSRSLAGTHSCRSNCPSLFRAQVFEGSACES
jgi:hypothetical protein